jgi:hypothetical protein
VIACVAVLLAFWWPGASPAAEPGGSDAVASSVRWEVAPGLRYLLPAGPERELAGLSVQRRSLATAIHQAAVVGVLEAGVAAAKEALVECQKGEYPGGGMGSLSFPFGRVGAITDHCRR